MIVRIASSTAIALVLCALIFTAANDRTTEAAFPGSNGRIVVVDNEEDDYELTTMNADGSDRQVIPTGLTFVIEPAFGPDGETVFFRGLDGTDGLYYINTSPGITGGGGPTHIPNTQGNYYDPAVSPDGQWVTFDHAEIPNPADIWVINIDGTGLTNLTDSLAGNEFSSEWSPDGTKIAYVRQEDGQCCDSDIWIMNADGSGQTNVTNTPDYSEGFPDWSPDGSRIIFDRSENLNVAGDFGPRDIATINVDGTGFQNLTNDPTTSQSDPAFSPDGTQILYSQVPSAGVSVSGAFGFSLTVVVANADGSDPIEISPPGAVDSRPDWGIGEPSYPLIWGDNNCSTEADPVDSLLTLRFDAGLTTNTGECPEFDTELNVIGASLHPWGDVDCGDTIDPVDSLKLLRYDAGLSVAQTEGCPEIGSEVQISPS
jgi:Tol biopolymer transport system component